ncbi:SGNH/GDSL hydrolase family protein [Mucilaginibacter corticis]|uniref:SGNH/GDSL hydrolase family protein n=1 Tax=Mucilaginibacter corticis TaxID=2597670 RepID=A0A556MKD0_9SPHI|nr:SGNH/GDSL hydrolase family protein [Mucilaginibacter corticis]TSJ40368.1 SGNH/GDSL hydrolase family protein [Mucilaginibacter corticis]
MKSRTIIALGLYFALCCGFIVELKSHGKPYPVINPSLDTLKIVYFGSSVPYGIGAKNNFGYTQMFSRLLQQRADNGTGKAWKTVNKSVGGDNTVRLLARWQRDLVPQKAKYVVYALSLGNEGIHEHGKPMYEQFKTNMTKLITMARDSGYVPIVTNCYTRTDFTEADYYYVKQLNLWINDLDVPSVNLLGAIDDGTGKWVTQYRFNDAHPNDAGHTEMSYTIVPSLFDALANGKPEPKLIDASYLSWGGKEKTKLLAFKPDNTLHAFTTCITVKADGEGKLLQLKDSTGKAGDLEISSKGFINYKSANHETITGNTKITDGNWHKIILTHYYARGETDLYCDSTLQGKVTEKLVIKELDLGKPAGKALDAKNWLFYRSGMNITEAKALTENKLLKSSLELYAPLDDKHNATKDVLVNLAQSTNEVKWVK